jgi:hypothetical protein
MTMCERLPRRSPESPDRDTTNRFHSHACPRRKDALPKRTFSLGLVAIAALTTIAAGVASPLATNPALAAVTPGAGDHWVATWTSMPQLTEASNMPPAPFTQGSQVMVDTTLRQTMRVTIGGSRFHLHVNNIFGGAPLPITAASVALPANGKAGVSSIQAGSAKAVTFNGQPSVSVPVGKEALSDPLDFTVANGSNLTVTLYLATGQASANIASHPGSRTTSYMVRGNHLTDTTLSSPPVRR